MTYISTHSYVNMLGLCDPSNLLLVVHIWMDLLKGLQSYGGFKLWPAFPKLSAHFSYESVCWTPKSFRNARTCLRSSITMTSLVGLRFYLPLGDQKCRFFCLCMYPSCFRTTKIVLTIWRVSVDHWSIVSCKIWPRSVKEMGTRAPKM